MFTRKLVRKIRNGFHFGKSISRTESCRIAEKRECVDNLRLAPNGACNSRSRIAFIGGRGVISKYSGIESYYEEVGKHLARRGCELTIYCRS